jgi:hypothetical protein
MIATYAEVTDQRCSRRISKTSRIAIFAIAAGGCICALHLSKGFTIKTTRGGEGTAPDGGLYSNIGIL